MSEANAAILVVEDEAHLAAGLKLNFELDGYEVVIAATGREGAAALAMQRFDVVVLDVMLPDFDGFELCKRMRDVGNFTPVIMLTARAAPDDRIRGLESGADDYLVKPFSLQELLARVRSQLRRSHWERKREPEPSTSELVHFGAAQVDFAGHVAVVRGETVQLTRLERDLLRYLIDHAGRAVSRQELLENVWQLGNYPNTRTVDNFVVRLRKMLEEEPARPRFLLSIRGTGYKFDPTGGS